MSNNMKRMFFSRDNGLQSQASLFAKSGIFFDFMLTNTEKRDRVIEVMDAEGLSELKKVLKLPKDLFLKTCFYLQYPLY